MKSYTDVFKNKHKVLFVTAHPDDADVLFGALMARLVSDNKEIRVLSGTLGARGSQDNHISEAELEQLRHQEQTASLAKLGVSPEAFTTLGYKDGELENSMKLIGQIAEVIREFRPDIVCTHDPNTHYISSSVFETGHFINHRDHRMIGSSTLDAVYPFARDRSFFPDQIKNGLEPHLVYEVFLPADVHQTVKMEMTAFQEQKRQALLQHTSQFSEDTVREIMNEGQVGQQFFEHGHHLELMW